MKPSTTQNITKDAQDSNIDGDKGSVIDTPKVIMNLQTHMDVVWDLFGLILGSPFSTVMLWPIVFVGSCCIGERQCIQISNLLKAEEFGEIFHVKQAATLLQTLWEDSDRRPSGPFGLHFIMQSIKSTLAWRDAST